MNTDARVGVIVTDRVDPAITAKLRAIATQARGAGDNVGILQRQLDLLRGVNLSQLTNQIGGLSRAMQVLTNGNLILIQQLNQINQAANAAAQGAARLSTAQANAAIAAQRLAAAQARTARAQSDAATAAQRLLTEQQRTIAQTHNAAAAADRAALAALRLAQARRQEAEASRAAAGAQMSYIKGLLLAAGGGIGAASILQTADAYTVLQNKLVNLAENQESVNMLTEKMYEISNRTGQAVGNTASAFQKFDNAMMQMGRGQEETLRLIETLNKATVVSGATTSEAAAGILQLGQAFGSGRLQGDEFRSIMENIPVVADLIAKSMGKTRGELKLLSSQGKITAEELRIAFEKGASEIDAKFAKTTFTLAQTMSILGNAFSQFIGELNKSIGLTSSLSNLVRFMSTHMRELAVAATLVGSVLLVAFGPALITALNLATAAAVRFTFALATNPIGLLVVGLSTAIAYIALFGKEIQFGTDKITTLYDVMTALFSFVGDGFRATIAFVSSAWGSLIDWLNTKTNGWAEKFRNIFDVIVAQSKTNTNFLIGVFVAAFNSIVVYWKSLPAIMQNIFASIGNFGISAAEAVINSWQMSFRSIASILAKIAPETAKSMNDALDVVTLKIGRIETGGGIDKAIKDISKEISDAMAKDYIGDAASAILNRAHNQAAGRLGVSAGGGSLRPDSGIPAATPVDPKALKAAENRAKALAKINGELDSQIKNMFKLSDVRAVDQALDNIELNLAQKKIKLSDSERNSIRAKIQAVNDATVVQRQYDSLYEEAIGPQRDYLAGIDAVDKLLSESAITYEKAAEFTRKLTEDQLKAVDPFYEFNRGIGEQLTLLKLLGPAQDIERQIMQKRNELLAQGKELSVTDANIMRQKLLLVQQTTEIQSVLNDQYNDTIARQSELAAKQIAYNVLLQQGKINAEQYGVSMQKLAVDAANLKLQMGNGDMTDVLVSGLGGFVANYQNVLTGLSSAWGDFFTSFTDGFSDSIGKAIVQGDSLKESLQGVAQQVLTGLISALVKLGIQYVVNAALGTSVGASALAAQTGMSAAAAAATAAAWATPAALVSLASFGANSAPAIAGITATNALTSAMAVTSAIPGFETGGYTGNGGRKEMAGVVHGQEFVMNADATARNRGLLETLNNGGSVSSASGASSKAGNVGNAGVTVIIENYGTDINVQQIDENTVKVIARREAVAAVRETAGDVVAADLRNPNSSMSKSVGANTTTQRKR